MSIDALIGEVLGQVRGIARDVLQREGTRLRTATVTAVSPLRIQYDGEDQASVVAPRCTTAVTVGDRVVVAKARGQATVLGTLGTPVWTPVSFLPGWGAATPVEYQVDGTRVRLRGRFQRTPYTAIEAGVSYDAAVIPPGLTPRNGFRSAMIGGTSSVWGRLELRSDGTLDVAAISGNAAWLDLGETSWTRG